jgi:poly(3-hydroxybutyrate) depolymerase
MSTAWGQIRFDDGEVLFASYQGVTDSMCTRLTVNRDEAGGYASCDCDQGEDVELATDYGGGHSWRGRACRHCRAVVDGSYAFPVENETGQVLIPAPAGYSEGLPEWWIS